MRLAPLTKEKNDSKFLTKKSDYSLIKILFIKAAYNPFNTIN